MSRRKTRPSPQKQQTGQRPVLRVIIEMKGDGTIETDPQFNRPAIEHLDALYEAANREDYDKEWTDDHKIAFFISDLMDGVLAQWEGPVSPEEVDAPVAPIPHIREAPVRDVYDIGNMESANPASKKLN